MCLGIWPKPVRSSRHGGTTTIGFGRIRAWEHVHPGSSQTSRGTVRLSKLGLRGPPPCSTAPTGAKHHPTLPMNASKLGGRPVHEPLLVPVHPINPLPEGALDRR